MQKWTALFFATVVAVFVAATIASRVGTRAPAPTAIAEAARDAGADAADAGPGDAGEVDGGSTDEPSSPDAPTAATSDAGAMLLNGTMAPPLAADAPKSVVFGVILVQYKGAQLAPSSSRSREAALELAKQLAADAKTDFKGAVQKGDKGSMENAGRMPRGMLEPAPEYVLFSLPKEGVSDPVDTPRGFWIARRIE
jgi:hypothetical protein